MATKKEDVLMEIPDVRHKGGDGTLVILNERIAWMTNNRMAVAHHFSDIKMQKISPDGKAKVQLQILLHDGNSSTFHFVNKNGSQAQIDDRNKVKQLVQKLLPTFRRKVDKELEQKNKLLSENPHLFQLYKNLVTTQIITSEEFWNSYGNGLNEEINKKQQVPVSGSFLAEIKPVADGCNGLKYNLTADMIECIFKTYPMVKKKYLENVPDTMNESEFWMKFFQSHYFHKDRIVSGFKDIFSDCDKVDAIALKLAIQKNLGDPFLDLTRFGDNTIDEDFCSSSYNDQRVVENSGNIVNQSIVKRFNHHSFQVLKTLTDKGNNEHEVLFKAGILKSLSKNKEPNIDKICEQPALTEEEIEKEKLMKSKKLMEKIHYEDLAGDGCNGGGAMSDVVTMSRPINLEKLKEHLFGSLGTSDVKNGVDLTVVDKSIKDEIKKGSWEQRTPHKNVLQGACAVSALGELSPGGILMQGLQETNLSNFVPGDVEKEIRNIYVAARELLKSFWSCFPVVSKESEEKLQKAYDYLQKFQLVKIKPLEERVTRELAPLGNQLLKHLNLMIQKAFEKYNNLQERKNKKK